MDGECQNCGRTFTRATTGRPARFCSDRCRVYFHRSHRIPAELTSRPRWVRHCHKRPVTKVGRPASVTDPSTWTTFPKARASKVGDGLGFVLGEGIGCLDFDHVIHDGVLDPPVANLIATLPATFTEVSPSGSGLHVWGRIPQAPGRVLTVDGVRVERYSQARYLTVTGQPWGECPRTLADLSDTLTW